jgi:hypothetical protein
MSKDNIVSQGILAYEKHIQYLRDADDQIDINAALAGIDEITLALREKLGEQTDEPIHQ